MIKAHRHCCLLLILSCFFLSCAKVSPAEQTAMNFVEAYYVETNLKAAEQWSDGLAREKIRQGLELTQGQAITRSTHRPDITTTLLTGSVSGSEAEYLFRVEIRPPEVSPMVKKTRIKVRERDGLWKVTQFSDFESGDGE